MFIKFILTVILFSAMGLTAAMAQNYLEQRMWDKTRCHTATKAELKLLNKTSPEPVMLCSTDDMAGFVRQYKRNIFYPLAGSFIGVAVFLMLLRKSYPKPPKKS